MKKLNLISMFLILVILTSTVSASTLGSTLIDSYTVEIGNKTTSTHNKWYSDQSGVGQQV